MLNNYIFHANYNFLTDEPMSEYVEIKIPAYSECNARETLKKLVGQANCIQFYLSEVVPYNIESEVV